ncbi:hypothetical protein HYH03_016120 [Edaphochlamys debaryana]|uniref:Uncharacterized protein n=1 Tax=Edaphochlamys debaryana TaxID=47281 RepID=A0A835XJA6_9CHLO|nr:hypothetical protein HYH03_016120 [Edaphochlamys debaryana]|eukprot:KAG2485133.1 hypothetical protein HYH03_016120 [Edaphochlamys debaryana]
MLRQLLQASIGNGSDPSAAENAAPSPDSPAEATEDTLGLRIAAVFIILAAGLIGGVPPLYTRALRDADSIYTFLIRAFAAGVIMALALVHIVPEAIEELAGIGGVEYPVGGCSVLFGVVVMVLIEHGAHMLVGAGAGGLALHAHSHGPGGHGGPGGSGPSHGHGGHGHGAHGGSGAVEAGAGAGAEAVHSHGVGLAALGHTGGHGHVHGHGHSHGHGHGYPHEPQGLGQQGPGPAGGEGAATAGAALELALAPGGQAPTAPLLPPPCPAAAADVTSAAAAAAGGKPGVEGGPALTALSVSVSVSAGAAPGGSRLPGVSGHCHDCVARSTAPNWATAVKATQAEGSPLRLRILAYLFELGCIFHSFIIGLSLGVNSTNLSEVRALLIALSFHQALEGISLASVINRGGFSPAKALAMVAGYSVTCPAGVAIGIGISEGYDPESTSARAAQGVLNGVSGGMLLYISLVQLVAEDMGRYGVGGPGGQPGAVRLPCFVALAGGAASMCLLAVWA